MAGVFKEARRKRRGGHGSGLVNSKAHTNSQKNATNLHETLVVYPTSRHATTLTNGWCKASLHVFSRMHHLFRLRHRCLFERSGFDRQKGCQVASVNKQIKAGETRQTFMMRCSEVALPTGVPLLRRTLESGGMIDLDDGCCCWGVRLDAGGTIVRVCGGFGVTCLGGPGRIRVLESN